MSDSWMAAHPRIEEASKPKPSSNVSSPSSPIGKVRCCQEPGRSVNRTETNLARERQGCSSRPRSIFGAKCGGSLSKERSERHTATARKKVGIIVGWSPMSSLDGQVIPVLKAVFRITPLSFRVYGRWKSKNTTTLDQKSYRPSCRFLLHCAAKRSIRAILHCRILMIYSRVSVIGVRGLQAFPQVEQETAN